MQVVRNEWEKLTSCISSTCYGARSTSIYATLAPAVNEKDIEETNLLHFQYRLLFPRYRHCLVSNQSLFLRERKDYFTYQ
jgi:hypothetical protein